MVRNVRFGILFLLNISISRTHTSPPPPSPHTHTYTHSKRESQDLELMQFGTLKILLAQQLRADEELGKVDYRLTVAGPAAARRRRAEPGRY